MDDRPFAGQVGNSRGLAVISNRQPIPGYVTLTRSDRRENGIPDACAIARRGLNRCGTCTIALCREKVAAQGACSSVVEHGAHNPRVAGSNPAGPTRRAARLDIRFRIITGTHI